tara:strand:+ start:349 stop:2025 length:1677 start_codon:yes stop_codon:yes gene_type:complete
MAEYYDYQKRDPNAQVNWAEVGANFSNMLNEEVRVRKEKKAAIDEASRQQQIIFDTAPQGDSGNMNDWTLDYADQGTKQLQMMDRLLRSGSLSVKDYTKARQNLGDGTSQLFDLAKGYQEEYANKMLRSDCTDPSGVGCSQQLELDIMASVEGFGNFSNSEAVIDPVTGRVMVGFSKFNEEKGIWELDSDPNSLVGINSLNNRIKGKFNLYDMDGEVTKAVKNSFGEYETIRRKIGTARQKGILTKISDPRFNTEESVRQGVKLGIFTEEEGILLLSNSFDEVRDQWINGQTADPKVVTSLLTNNLGNEVYKFTFNEAEAEADKDELTILLKNVDNQVVPDFTTEIGKRQKKKAQDGLSTVLEGAMDHKVETTIISDAYTSRPPVGNPSTTPKDYFQLIPTTTSTGKGTGKPRPGSTIESQEEGQSFVFANAAGDKGIKGVIANDAEAEVMMVNYNPDTQKFTASLRYTEKVTTDSGDNSSTPGQIKFSESGQSLQSSDGKKKSVSTDTKSYDLVLTQPDIGLLAIQLGLNTQENLVKEIMKTINPNGSTSKYNKEKK